MNIEFAPPTPEEIKKYHTWWAALSAPWKQTFNEVTLQRSSTDDLPLAVLHQLWNAPALRFAGPTAPYPNMSIELDNIEGVLALKKLEIFVFTFHQLKSLEAIKQLPQLKSLFVFNNQIQSLEGVEHLKNLQELYFQMNQVTSLKPLKHLTQLHTVYCHDNRLTSFEGIGTQHRLLKQFFCIPNPSLPDAKVMRFEKKVGIRCRGGL